MTTSKKQQTRDLSHYELKEQNLLIGLNTDNEKIRLDVELKVKRPQKSWEDLQNVDFPLCLSISGNIGSHSGGQNYEEIQNLIADNKIIYKNNWNKNKLFKIVEIWKRYHLNDLKAASKRQEQLFKMHQNSKEFLRFLEYEKTINKKDFDSYETKKLLLNIYDNEYINKSEELRDKKKILEDILKEFNKRAWTKDFYANNKRYNLKNIIKEEIKENWTLNRVYNDKRQYIYNLEKIEIAKQLQTIETELQKPEYYSYGSSWLYEPIPIEIIKEIHNIIDSLNDSDINLNDMIINEDFTNKLDYEIKPIGLTKSPWNKDQSVMEYKITLTFETRKMIFPFYCGLGCSETTIFNILECLQLDCQLFNNYDNIDDFANEMGIEKPSEAIKQFKAFEKQYNELKELFNNNFDLFLNSDIS